MTRRSYRSSRLASSIGWTFHHGLASPAVVPAHTLHLPSPRHADLPFDERVERAWSRLLARFEDEEHERLRVRERLVELIEGDRREANDREPY